MDVTTIALAVSSIAVSGSLVAAVLARSRSTRALGAPVAAEIGARSLYAVPPLVAAVAAVLLGGAEPLPLVLLFAAIALWFLAPRTGDRVLGRDGVRRGWTTLRFERIVEWRLTGDHLRVLLRGEWEAVPAPSRDHEALRKVLEERAPGRESRFTS
ncbi:MAG: hypothetical protein R3F34_14375 [Planctomycetota bacterium]